jgi:hypothetical protein
MLMDWEKYLSHRKSYLASVWTLRKLSVEDQVKILREALKASNVGAVLGYLHEVEKPARRGHSRPVSEAMVKWLVGVATFPGEWSSDARDLVIALVNDDQGKDVVFSLVDQKIQECHSNPDDDEIWLHLAFLLREINPAQFDSFVAECRSHASEKIREVAAFFD